MALQQTTLYDGSKAVPLSRLPEEAWDIISGGTTGKSSEVEDRYSSVAFLYRCVEVRANSFVTVPWTIYRNDSEVWDSGSDMPPAELEWASDLPELLWLTESALTLTGTAFWANDANRMGTKRSLGWYAPKTMRPKWDESAGLIGFIRHLGGRDIPLSAEEVVYIYLPNGLHETMPRPAPVVAALRAAGVIYNVDSFAEAFFKRGAIKTTLLTVKGKPLQAERDRLKTIWDRITRGIDRAFGTEVVNAEAVQPVVIGEGISELTDVKLTSEKREDIATAFGVPHSLVLSNASNFSVSEQDERNFFTQTVLPQTQLVQRQLNRQLFGRMGYRLQFMPEAMSMFQEDEEQRSASVRSLVLAGVDTDLAMEILGYDLTDEQWTRLRQSVAEKPQRQQDIQALVTSELSEQERLEEGKRFQRWAKKRDHPNPAEFKSDLLTDADKIALLWEDGAAGTMRPFVSRLRSRQSKIMN